MDIASPSSPSRVLAQKVFQSSGGIQTIFSYFDITELIFRQHICKRFYSLILPRLVNEELKIALNYNVKIQHDAKSQKLTVTQKIQGNRISNHEVSINDAGNYIQCIRKDKLYAAVDQIDGQPVTSNKGCGYLVEFDIKTQAQMCYVKINPREYFALISFLNYVLVIGGQDSRPVKTIDAFDVRTKSIDTSFPNLQEPTAETLVTQVSKNTLYVIGSCKNGYMVMYQIVQRLVYDYRKKGNQQWEVIKIKNPWYHLHFSKCEYDSGDGKITLLLKGKEEKFKFYFEKLEVFRFNNAIISDHQQI